MKSEIAIFVVIIFILVLLGFGVYFLSYKVNQSMVSHKLISPKDGVECVVVTAKDSSSVDCWKVTGQTTKQN